MLKCETHCFEQYDKPQFEDSQEEDQERKNEKSQLSIICESDGENHSFHTLSQKGTLEKSMQKSDKNNARKFQSYLKYQFFSFANNNQNFNIANILQNNQQAQPKFLKQNPNHEAKFQILKELKIDRIFQAWKRISFNLHKQIQQEADIVRQNLQIMFKFFLEWKILAVKEKRAQEYYKKKIYRLFFMTCSSLLELRYRAIYFQEILKLGKFPYVLHQLKKNFYAQQRKVNFMAKKVAIKLLRKRSKLSKIEFHNKKLAQLNYEFQLKKRYWFTWQKYIQQIY